MVGAAKLPIEIIEGYQHAFHPKILRQVGVTGTGVHASGVLLHPSCYTKES